MKRVDNQEFFKQLSRLFEDSENHGSVYLVQKRLSSADVEPAARMYPLLFRASNGARNHDNRISVSTIVQPDQLPGFWQQYSEALKHGSSGLKRKDKKKKKEKRVVN